MKKSILLTSLLALAACGGGSGGGTSGGIINPEPNPVVPDANVVSPEAIESNKAILSMDSKISDETKRTAYLKSQFGEEEYNNLIAELRGDNIESDVSEQSLTNRAGSTRGNGNSDKNICKSERDCNQMIFDNMLAVLNNLDNLDKMSEKDVKNALIAAGFKSELSGMWDDVKGWIRENKDNIISKGEEVFETPGQGKPVEFRLNNAEFKTMLTTITNGVADKMTLNIDEKTGEVIGIKFADVGSGSSEYNPDVFYQDGGLKRADGTNKFDFNSDRTSGELIMESYAKDLGLRYADFGVLVADKGATYTDDKGNKRDMSGYQIPFAGGYEAKRIAAADIQNNNELDSEIQFKGIAKGTVEAPNVANVAALPIEDENAVLAFNRENGSETLTADFANWYQVDITKDNQGLSNITFNGDGKDIDKNYQVVHTPLSGTVPNENAYFETGYYGDNKSPDEAVALFQYQQQIDAQHQDDGNINVFIGFGGKKAE